MKNKPGFIARVKRNGHATGRSHVWDGVDTLCHQWLTDGGLKRDEWEYFGTPPRAICELCKSNPVFKTMQFDDFNYQKSLFD